MRLKKFQIFFFLWSYLLQGWLMWSFFWNQSNMELGCKLLFAWSKLFLWPMFCKILFEWIGRLNLLIGQSLLAWAEIVNQTLKWWFSGPFRRPVPIWIHFEVRYLWFLQMEKSRWGKLLQIEKNFIHIRQILTLQK